MNNIRRLGLTDYDNAVILNNSEKYLGAIMTGL